jgi:hypothetical protein
MMMLIFYSIIRLAFAVASLALLSSIPAAGQATPPLKLSPQQLNPPPPNKPIAAPGTYSPNGNKLIAAPGTSSPNGNKLITAPTAGRAFQRPLSYMESHPNPHSGRNVANREAADAKLGADMKLPNIGGGPWGPSPPCIYNCQ